jgi:hypothetical protein
METSNSLNPKESLDLIVNTINRTKENFREHNFLFLLWGWLIASASIVHFVMFKYSSLHYPFISWPILSGSGIIISLAYVFRKKAASANETYFSFFLYRLWLVVGIGFILTVVVSLLQNMLPFTYTLIIAGFGTTISGLVMRFKPLVIGGILFFLSSLTSVFLSDEYKILLHSAAIILGYLIPGYLLKNSDL